MLGRVKDYAGKVIGRATVIRFTGNFTSYRSALWECECSCGKIFITSANTLSSGSVSCGCSRKIAIPGKTVQGSLYASYRSKAEERVLSFSLSRERFLELTACRCFYCNALPVQKMSKKKTGYGEYYYNGIDRVDNTKGYEEGNVVPCCGTCNKAKGTLSMNEFILWIRRVNDNTKEWAL